MQRGLASGGTIFGLKKMSRPTVVTQLSVLTCAIALLLVSIFLARGFNAIEQERQSEQALFTTQVALDILSLRERFRHEIGSVDVLTSHPNPLDNAMLKRAFEAHNNVVLRLDALQPKLKRTPAGREAALRIERLQQKYKSQFSALMDAVQEPQGRDIDNSLRSQESTYALIDEIDSEAVRLSGRIAGTGPFLSEMMKVSDVGWYVRAYAGTDRRALAKLILSGRSPTPSERDRFSQVIGLIDGPWDFLTRLSVQPRFPSNLKDAIAKANDLYFGKYRALRREIIKNSGTPHAIKLPHERWLEISNPPLGSLMEVSNIALRNAQAHAKEDLQNARRELWIALLLMAASVALALSIALFVFRRIIAPLKAITDAISKAEPGQNTILRFRGRSDEIGRFANAICQLKDGVEERERLHLALLKSRMAAETAQTTSRIKSEFLANMSHELRTPLNAVIGFSDMILSRTFGPLPEKYSEYAGLINGAGKHLLNLISDILDLAKIEAGKFVPDLSQVNFLKVAEECVALLAPQAQEKHIQICISCSGATPIGEADERSVRQVFLNILANAVKFSSSHSEIDLAIAVNGEGITIRVEDRGIGIAKELIPRLGRAFEQSAHDPQKAREGTGLGLALVFALTSAHGGSVTIDSEIGAGTTVTVHWPSSQPHLRAA